MARDDRFKRYQEAGAEFLEAARTRAEEFLRELAQMGDSTQRQAQDAVDDLVEGGRKGTEQILTSIRREITTQLSQLGLATKDDLADLEGRLAGRGDGPPPPGAARGAAAGETAGGPPAPATKAPAERAGPDDAAAKKIRGKKGAPAKKGAPVKKGASAKKAAPTKRAAGEV
jgi:polyhydroxyalkanoate synthesis regulator phasin